MKIAVIGTGAVGGTLGRRWAELGNSVCFGVRDLSDVDARALVGKIKGDARLANMRDAVKDADVVVLATPYAANAAVIASAGDLASKILIDVTNPIDAKLALAVRFNTSVGGNEARAGSTGFQHIGASGIRGHGKFGFHRGEAGNVCRR